MTDTISALFETQVKQKPCQVAVIDRALNITYQELSNQVNQIAHYLKQHGLVSQAPVALCMERSSLFIALVLGILKAGGAYIPLDPRCPQKRMRLMLKDAQPQFLFVADEFIHLFSDYRESKIPITELFNIVKDYPTHFIENPSQSNHLAYILYTSGSTGIPKGVLIEQGALVNYARYFARHYTFLNDQVIDFSANYVFDMSISLSIVPIMLGWTVTICPDDIKKDPRQYLSFIKEHRVNLIKMIPSYLRVLLQEVKQSFIDLPDLKAIGVGGEPFFTNDCKHWLKYYPNHLFFNEYGPTETTIAVTHFKITQENIKTLGITVPIGEPFENTRLYLVDQQKRPVSQGELGELYIGGFHLARGYLNQANLTEASFHTTGFPERVYKTGDVCRQLPNGHYEFIERHDKQIKIRGCRVEPTEIEQCLMNHPEIKDAVVIVRDDKPHQLIAYYTTFHYPRNLSIEDLRLRLKEDIPEYMIPNLFLEIQTLPLTSSGKIDKNALPKPALYSKDKKYTRKLTPITQKLKQIWEAELGILGFNTTDNFFELGGHSLSAARIISEINHHFRKAITLEAFYKAPTIRGLAKIIEKTSLVTEAKNFTSRKKSKPWPLSDFQFILWLSNQFEPKARKLNIVAQRRIQGLLDPNALAFAVKALQKKQVILTSKTLLYKPAQVFNVPREPKIESLDLRHVSVEKVNQILNHSIEQLLRYRWKREAPFLLRVFTINEDLSEIQICLPHIICDDRCPDIIFKELSHFYLAYKPEASLLSLTTETLFREYLTEEQNYFINYLDRDLRFWKDYLRDANLFEVQQTLLMPKTLMHGYSTYFPIDDSALEALRFFCARAQISIHDGLCAAIAKALSNLIETNQTKVLFNRVKSTRNHHRFDDTIGCFLSLEPILINLDKNLSFETMARNVHEASLKTLAYQRFSSLMKFACVQVLCQKRTKLKELLIKTCTYLYTALFKGPSINRKILNFCTKLAKTNTLKTHFIININIQSQVLNFKSNSSSENLFGFKKVPHPSIQYDLLEIDNFLDICFVRENDHTPISLVISANLVPQFRQKMAQEILTVLNNVTHWKKEKSPLILDMSQ